MLINRKKGRRLFYAIMFVSILLWSLCSSNVFADIIIDNGDPGTSFTGDWSVSGDFNPWDPDDPSATSLWSKKNNDTYTWTFTPSISGSYEFSMWWTQSSSRDTNIPISIEFLGGTDTVPINQQANGGQWNVINTYPFEAGVSYDITITSQPGPLNTCADAVRFVFVLISTHTITATAEANGTITPFGEITVNEGDNQVFNISPDTGYHVADVLVDDSSVGAVASYTFNNVIADHTIAAFFEADVPTHTITATAEANGSITPSGDVTVNEGDDQVFNISPDTGYHVAEVLVNGSSVGAVASYTFNNVIADHTIAAFFEADVPGSVIIDNGDPETSSTGAWSVSSASGWYGTNSVWSRDGSIYRWTFSPSVSGYYAFAMWWTTWPSRSTTVPVIIEHAEGSTVVNINQQLNGGQWNVINTYPFEAGVSYDITITSQPGPSSTCADAVRFVFAPMISTHTITATAEANGSITPSGDVTVNEGDDQVFNISSDTGYHVAEVLVNGSSVGAVASYTFNNVIADHTIAAFFEADVPGSVIIDNGDTGTSFTGTWRPSSGANPYGATSGSLTIMTPGATYTFETPIAGDYYTVSLWWTYYASRCTRVPVDIYDGSNLLDTVEVNQQENGGQWNTIGSYFFQTGTARVVIRSTSSTCSTCADAVSFDTAIPPELDYIVVGGSANVNEASSAQYTCTAHYLGGASRVVEPDSCEVDCTDHASITQTGLLTTYEVETDQPCQITMNYEEGGITRTDNFDITIMDYVPPAEIIIDNRDAEETSQTGTWEVSGATDPYGADSVYSRDGATFTWYLTPSQSGIYEVSMWWTAWASRSLNVPVDIEHSDGVATVYVDQQENGGQWNVQGHYYFESGTTYDIIITSQPYPSSTCADAIKFSFITDGSFVEILEPSSYYLQTFPDLTVSAVAINLELAWKIKFIIDLGTSDERSIIDTSEPYEVLFNSLTEREHTVDVFVVDGSNSEVPGTYTQDQIIQVGIGHYYVAIGDSITEGFGDDDPSDDISLDGRNSGPGYESILNNLLTADASGIPHTIVNEGVGGATSSDGRESILTILAKHSESQRFFVQFGTNDARPWLPVPSGKELIPNDPGYPGTFKDNMQHIIDEINSEEKEVCLGKPPITLGDGIDSTPYANPDEGARNVLIKEYNEVIDELKNDPQNNIMVTPPDFYSLFNEDVSGGKRYDFEYADNLHPNNDGYHSMANHWLESLIP